MVVAGHGEATDDGGKTERDGGIERERASSRGATTATRRRRRRRRVKPRWNLEVSGCREAGGRREERTRGIDYEMGDIL